MQIFKTIDELSQIKRPVVLAAGVFDGVHLGHQAVLQTALDAANRSQAEPVVLTFDPHPSTVLRQGHVQPLLTPTEYKLRLIEKLGIKKALILNFNAEFAAIEAEEFIHKLRTAAYELSGICIGQGWRFGHNRQGDAKLLQLIGMRNGFFTCEVAPVKINDTIVSSTLIRQAIAEGNLKMASEFLGRDFAISGHVVEGRKIGRQIGFPTANISSQGEQFPPDGVYVVDVAIGKKKIHGVANIGLRPSVSGEGQRILEIHLFDFKKSLYGQEIEVTFLEFLRAEKKFESLDLLREQIQRDVAQARAWFGKQME